MPIHPIAEAFADAVDDYERGRPEYPQEAVALLTRRLGLNRSSRTVELGAGSGKFTRGLLREGVTPVALEPIGAMRATLKRHSPAVPILAATAEALPFRDHTLDAVLAAQAFHWFRPDATMRELARVLRTRGGVGLLWNMRDEEVDWVARFGEIIRAHEPPDAPHFRSGVWKSAFDGHANAFGPLHLETFHHEHRVDREGLVARARSVSYIAALPPAELTKVEDEIRALWEQTPELRGRENLAFPYRTDVYWSFRR